MIKLDNYSIDLLLMHRGIVIGIEFGWETLLITQRHCTGVLYVFRVPLSLIIEFWDRGRGRGGTIQSGSWKMYFIMFSLSFTEHRFYRGSHTLAKLAICSCIFDFGYSIIPGLNSQFLPNFPTQPAFKVATIQ